MKKLQFLALFLLLSGLETSAQVFDASIEKKIDVLLKKMTLKEKIGIIGLTLMMGEKLPVTEGKSSRKSKDLTGRKSITEC